METFVAILFLVALLVFSYLAWHGFGLWVLGLAEVNEPPRRWQRWWTAFWWVFLVYSAVGAVGELYPDGPPEGGAAFWFWAPLVVALPIGLASLGFSFMFAFREGKRRWKGRSE